MSFLLRRIDAPSCPIELQASCSVLEADGFEYYFIGFHEATLARMSLFDGYLEFVLKCLKTPLKLRSAD